MRGLSLIAVMALLFATCTPARAQSCPDPGTWQQASSASTLHGRIAYHDELREWLGLKLDKSACGQDEIQLTFSEDKDWRQAEALRECEVTVIGTLFYSPTGYYSADMALADPVVAPNVTCAAHPVKSDPSLAPRKAGISTFMAEISVDYRSKGHVRVQVWEDSQRKSELIPWQAYLHYNITGLQDVIWFGCADGFDIRQISQNPKPKDGLIQDEPNLAGTVLQSEGLNTVSFACARESTGEPRQ